MAYEFVSITKTGLYFNQTGLASFENCFSVTVLFYPKLALPNICGTGPIMCDNHHLGLDTNHGYAQRQVENSEASKSRAVLERKLAKVQRQAQAARERRAKAEARSRQLEQRLKRERAQATRALVERRETMGAAGRVALPVAREARGVPAGGSGQTGPPPTAQAESRRHYRCGLRHLRAGRPSRARPASAAGRPGSKRTEDV